MENKTDRRKHSLLSARLQTANDINHKNYAIP